MIYAKFLVERSMPKLGQDLLNLEKSICCDCIDSSYGLIMKINSSICNNVNKKIFTTIISIFIITKKFKQTLLTLNFHHDSLIRLINRA